MEATVKRFPSFPLGLVPALGACLVLGACTGVGPLAPGGAQFSVTADSSLLEAIGAQTQLEIELPDGLEPAGLQAIWRSSAPSVASVDANGLVTAVGQGAATITAETGGMSASTVITVNAQIVGVARVRSDRTDSNPANDTASVTITVHAD
jgi:hypothetical protein